MERYPTACVTPSVTGGVGVIQAGNVDRHAGVAEIRRQLAGDLPVEGVRPEWHAGEASKLAV